MRAAGAVAVEGQGAEGQHGTQAGRPVRQPVVAGDAGQVAAAAPCRCRASPSGRSMRRAVPRPTRTRPPSASTMPSSPARGDQGSMAGPGGQGDPPGRHRVPSGPDPGGPPGRRRWSVRRRAVTADRPGWR